MISESKSYHVRSLLWFISISLVYLYWYRRFKDEFYDLDNFTLTFMAIPPTFLSLVVLVPLFLVARHVLNRDKAI
jgi:hypothetical protein